MVVGVSTGFNKVMELIGTGYRASVAGKELTLNVGYSKPRVLAIPEGLKVTVRAGCIVFLVPPCIIYFIAQGAMQIQGQLHHRRHDEIYTGDHRWRRTQH